MRKILLVDDERLEREGISALIDWPALSLTLIGAAKNGVEALEIIRREHPDIVITDIKMPVVSGLDLIEKAGGLWPDILFIVLSGYGDYELTSQAMRLGVRHYLLKPVTREKVETVLADASHMISLRETERAVLRNLEGNLERVLPHVKQQFLRDAALSTVYDQSSSQYYQKLFGIGGGRFRVVLLRIGSKSDFIDRFALKNMAEEIVGSVALSCMVERDVLLLVDDRDSLCLTRQCQELRRRYREYFHTVLTVSVSGADGFDRIHSMYQQSRNLLGVHFGLEDDCILFYSPADHAAEKTPDFSADIDTICEQVGQSRLEDLSYSLDMLFAQLADSSLHPPSIRSASKQLLRLLVNPDVPEDKKLYDDTIARIDSAAGDEKIAGLVKVMVSRLASRNRVGCAPNHSPVVEETICCIYENIDNPRLSLGWLAKDVLFMNEDYLGRVFQKEMHEKFSHFVLKARLELAKRLIENTQTLKIHEISRMAGFPEDSQYFSRMFKSYTHLTPTEYKRKLSEKAENTGRAV